MKRLVLFILVLISFDLMSQVDIEKINLNDYKLPDYKYHSLQVNFNFSGGSDYEATDDGASVSYRNNNSLSLPLGFRYRKIVNSRKKQLSRSIHFSTRSHFSSRNVNKGDLKSKSIDFSNYLSYNGSNRYYVSPLFFLERDLRLFILSDNFRRKSIFDNNTVISKNFSTRANVILPLKIGFGRVEIVSNAWKAYRILKDFKRYDLFENNISFYQDDIFDMANYITNRNYTRAFDSRLKFMDDLVGFSNTFLKNKAKFSNPLYYASLYDMWNYSVNNVRKSGKAFTFGIEPGFSYSKLKTSDIDSITLAVDLFSFVSFEYYKALGINWQLDFKIKAKGGIKDIFKSVNSEVVDNQRLKTYFYTSLGLGYYPTTRSGFYSKFTISDNTFVLFEDDAIGANNLSVRWDNNLYYYVSPQARLSAHISAYGRLDYETTEHSYIDGFRGGVNYDFGLVYFVF